MTLRETALLVTGLALLPLAKALIFLLGGMAAVASVIAWALLVRLVMLWLPADAGGVDEGFVVL